MTTSNPVVPSFEAVVQPRIPRSLTAQRTYGHQTAFRWWVLSDFATIILALIFLRYLVVAIVPGSMHAVPTRFPAIVFAGAAACTLLLWALGVYTPPVSPLNIHETEQLLRGASIIAVVTTITVSCVDLQLALIVFVASGLVGLLLIAQRSIVRRILSHRQERIRALIYARRLDGDLLTIIRAISASSIDLAGLLYDAPWELNRDESTPCRFVGMWSELKRAARQTGASHVLVVGCDNDSREIQRIVHKCERLKLDCSILLDPRNLTTTRSTYTFMHELPVLQRGATDLRPQLLSVKRGIDLVIGSCLLIVALPIGVLIAALVKYDSRGPIFFRQQRIGISGRSFELLKFRTMLAGSPKYHRSPASSCDPRITRIGRLLRRLSLDELPQILNVLKGDMSLVGPRPEMPFIVGQYNDAAWARLAVRPGITGLWQISRARSLPIHHSLQYDLFYIERQNIFLDTAILLRTLGAVVRGVGAM